MNIEAVYALDLFSSLVEKRYLGKPPRHRVVDMWDALEEAARSHHKCMIRYRKRGKGAGIFEYFVSPYSIRNKPGGDVLFAYDHSSRRIKCFFVSGITGVSVSERRFHPKWDVELSLDEVEYV